MTRATARPSPRRDSDRTVLAIGGSGRPRDDRDDLLGEHVQRVARHDGRLDQPFAHAPRDDRALQQVAAELGEDAPAADLADAVPGAPDPLQPARDRLGRLDLQHEVDGAHVDPELQRADVATRHGSSPAFSSSSTFVRSSRASEPWWARAISRARWPHAPLRPPEAASSSSAARCASASSFRRSATRSAERRLLTKTIVELCSRTSASSSG